MSHGNALTQKARYRSRCTGIGHQACTQQHTTAEGQHPVPDSGPDQARLEAQVFEHLGGTIDYCAHPAGIAHVIPTGTHLTVALDPKLGPNHRLSQHCLEALLPTIYTGTDEDPEGPGSAVGVRLRGIDADGLHLGLADTNARVTLAGPSQAEWTTALANHRARCRESHLIPLWDTPGLSEPERRYLDGDPAWWKEQADTAWLASGLLRRIALFHTVTKPYCVRYWRHGLGWRFELRYEHGLTVEHNTLIASLTHPKWGMPLQVKRDHCSCKPCACDGGAERNCWFTLEMPDGQGEVGMHFRRARADFDASGTYERLVTAGANARWLEQVLPAHHSRLSLRTRLTTGELV
ncbi:hypothetical protein AQJ43_36345 [Streptomyces avermitilis]|nr:hypothetical protein [Streptomyces avermitilis]KUN48761.1 hypothetical protein AQJ43_36345 [Streptomyces avermitilis]BBJ56374.1 hypothetical protein SAVMC3_90030 [Streptomyces avermitilis]GDY70407.1 hypothetical protein SAV14893_098000 [Streptomyces avermitilis]GDY80721.1 hypothetical protein SAV31267_102060 [Streptomyces avermitilis]